MSEFPRQEIVKDSSPKAMQGAGLLHRAAEIA